MLARHFLSSSPLNSSFWYCTDLTLPKRYPIYLLSVVTTLLDLCQIQNHELPLRESFVHHGNHDHGVKLCWGFVNWSFVKLYLILYCALASKTFHHSFQTLMRQRSGDNEWVIEGGEGESVTERVGRRSGCPPWSYGTLEAWRTSAYPDSSTI